MNSKPLSGLNVIVGFIGLALAAGSVQAQQNVGTGGGDGSTTTFATGPFVLPEGITAASSAYGGGYLVSDANGVGVNGTIYQIPASGGAASVFSATDFRVFGTTTLSSFYGAQSGQLLAVGTSTASTNGIAEVISPLGVGSGLVNQENSWFTSVTTATSNFGSIQAGQAVLANETLGSIQVLGADGQLSTFATVPGLLGQTFGTAFAPSTFGADAGDLFVSSVGTGDLYVLNAQGQSSLFASITLPPGALSPGLRQMAFAPAGFGQYGGDLFVSIAAQDGGGGDIGQIAVFDSSGTQLALYNQGSSSNPLDPRGLLFTTINGVPQLLASNADPEIDLVSALSFTGSDGGGGGGGGGGGSGSMSAPELDPNSGLSALTLLLGTIAVMHARGRGNRATARSRLTVPGLVPWPSRERM